MDRSLSLSHLMLVGRDLVFFRSFFFEQADDEDEDDDQRQKQYASKESMERVNE